jgi:hypothetical protein
MRNLSQDNQSSGQDINTGLPDYKAGELMMPNILILS